MSIENNDRIDGIRARSPSALPPQFDRLPVLDDFEFAAIASPEGGAPHLVATGKVSRGHKSDPGRIITTSGLVEIDGDPSHSSPWWCRTRNTTYRLGGRRSAVPPLVWAAEAATFGAAVANLLGRTGWHTIRKTKAGAVLSQRTWNTDAAIGLAKPHVRDLVAHLLAEGRHDLANAWSLLLADPLDGTSATAALLLLKFVKGRYDAIKPVIEAWRAAASGNTGLWKGVVDQIEGAHRIGAMLQHASDSDQTESAAAVR